MELENIHPAYKDCPECGKRQKNNKAYFECKDSDCGYIEKQWIRADKEEKATEKKVKEMVGSLLKGKSVGIIIVEEAGIIGNNVNTAVIRCGWYNKPPINQISIPRKSLYLPRKEIVDLSAHESSHPVSWEEDEKNWDRNLTMGWTDIYHGPVWYGNYRNNYHQLTNQYTSWINEPHQPRFTLGEKIPNPKSEYRDSLIYDPREDD